MAIPIDLEELRRWPLRRTHLAVLLEDDPPADHREQYEEVENCLNEQPRPLDEIQNPLLPHSQ